MRARITSAVVAAAVACLAAFAPGAAEAAPAPRAAAATRPVQLPANWLAQVNAYRVNYGVPRVTEDPALSVADGLHVRWMALNNTLMHGETPHTPGYTTSGDHAGAHSNLFEGSRDPIRGWMTAPFHALGILRPRLQRTGFAFYPQGSWSALDVLTDANGPVPAASRFPMTWPTNRSPVDLIAFGGEWPDPTTGCGRAPAAGWGLPLLASFGYWRTVHAKSATLRASTGRTVPVCMRQASSYTGVASQILLEYGTVLVIPRAPLAWRTHYTGTVVTDVGAAKLDFWTSAPR